MRYVLQNKRDTNDQSDDSQKAAMSHDDEDYSYSPAARPRKRSQSTESQ